MRVYLTYSQPDMTEGRSGLRWDGRIWADEQAAWDAVKNLPGVMGSFPPNCYPRQRLVEHNVTNWQEFKDVIGHPGDHDVRGFEVIS